jgi:hypothetical protein
VSWSPLSLGSTLKLWLRGDLGIHLTSGAVDTWADQSGNGNNATQANAPMRPVGIVTTIGGQQCVSINAGQALQLPNFVSTGAKTIILVYKFHAIPGTATVFCLQNAVRCAPYTVSSGIALTFDIVGNTFCPFVPRTWDTKPHVDYFDYNGGDNTLQTNMNDYVDGVPAIIFGTSSEGTSTNLSSIGADIPAAGNTTAFQSALDLAEFIVTDTVLSPTDRNLFGGYVFSRYGLLVAGRVVTWPRLMPIGF